MSEENHVKLFVPVPKEQVGRVIGTNGRSIIQLQKETKTSIRKNNGNGKEKRSGFFVSGSENNCQKACLEITKYVVPLTLQENYMEIFVPVPKEQMGRVIGTNGRNIIRVKKETKTVITTHNGDGKEETSGFFVGGTKNNCEKARLEITKNMNKDYESYEQKISISSKDAGIAFGAAKENMEMIETKSRTKIRIFSSNSDKVVLIATGEKEDCIRAESLVRQSIISFKDHLKKEELGGDNHFVCFNYGDENGDFCLVEGGSPPKLDGYLRGQRYRVQTEGDVDNELEFSEKTMSDIKDRLLSSLQELYKKKDENELLVDLWFHLGKVYVYNVDEDEMKESVKGNYIKQRLPTSACRKTGDNKHAYWRVSFEEGVDPSHMAIGALPESKTSEKGVLNLELVHTQWRYDFSFATPSGRYVRLKVWEGLPAEMQEPPVEVKNILIPVSLNDEDVKAYLCYPSTSVVRGDIMTPHSGYDCRVKLRAGPRYFHDKDVVCEEENNILAKYLSNCQLDRENHCLYLPDEKMHWLPKGFKCSFYRGATEHILRTTIEKESFIVVVYDQKGWDSDSSEKREQKQVGVRVVLESWSKAFLSTERNWEPTQIVDKLEDYMKFISLLNSHLFESL